MIPVRLSFFCVMLAYSNLVPLPALRVIFLDFPLKQTFVFPPLRDWMYKDVTLPFHVDDEASTGADTFHAAVLPFLRKSRK